MGKAPPHAVKALNTAGERKRRDVAAVVGSDDRAKAALADLVQRMDAYEHDRDDPVREVMARLGDRWSTLLLLILKAGTFRHATLRRLVNAMSAEGAISQRVLTLRLRALERDGLVRRTVTPTVPPQVEYALSPLGAELTERVDTLLAWIEANDDAIRAHRRNFAAREGAK